MNSSNKGRLMLVLLVVVLVVLPLFVRDQYVLDTLVRMGFWAILALGLQLLMTTGLMSVAQAASMAIGAYTSVFFVMKFGLSFWLGLPAAGVAASLFALVVGIPALRTKGIYFMMLTLGVSIVLTGFINRLSSLTGGPGGIVSIPPPDSISLGFATIQFGPGHKTSFYYLVLALTALTVWLVFRLNRSRVGAIFRSIRDSEALAQHIGVNPFGYKLMAFVICSFFAGVVGSLQAHYTSFISSETFPLLTSMYVIIYLMVGGTSVSGAVVGPLAMIGVGEALRFVPFVKGVYIPAIYGGILVVVMTFLPDGLVVLPRMVISKLRGIRQKFPPTSDNSSSVQKT